MEGLVQMSALAHLETRKVHLLLQTDPGRAQDVLATVTSVPGVIDAVVTSGAYDVVAQVFVADEHELATVLAGVRQAIGLSRLSVCRPGN